MNSCDIYTYIEKLCRKINNVLQVDPTVNVVISDDEYGGDTEFSYKKSEIRIEIKVPPDPLNVRKMDIAAILLHEYCHYKDALKMSGSDRIKSADEYRNSFEVRKNDEMRIWRETKKLAKLLDLWDRPFYKSVKKLTFTSMLTY